VTVCGAATYLVRDETLGGGRVGRRFAVATVACGAAKQMTAVRPLIRAQSVSLAVDGGITRDVARWSQRRVQRRLHERILGRPVVCSARGGTWLSLPSALLTRDHGSEPIRQSGDLEKCAWP